MLPPEKWKTVKQPKDSLVCVAAVGAMALGRSLRYATFRMKPSRGPGGRPYYRTRELLGLLGSHGIHCGEIAVAIDGKDCGLTRSSTITIESHIRNRQAICQVESDLHYRATHLVFWDGRWIRDPHPDAPDTMDIKAYQIQEIVPLVYIDEDAEGWWELIAKAKEE